MHKTTPHSLLITMAALGAVLAYPPAIPLLFPGIILMTRPFPDEHDEAAWDFSGTLINAIFLSLGYWIASAWILKTVGLPMTLFCYGTVGISILPALVEWWKKPTHSVTVTAKDVFILIALGLMTWYKLVPYLSTIAPAGADMSMHSYITRLIATTNGVPDSYQPLVNLDTFSAFPIGFHTVSAIISIISDLPPWRAAFLVACLSHAFFCMAIFQAARQVADWRSALACAIGASLLLRAPQEMAHWGGNPTVLGLAFIPMLLTGENLMTKRPALGATMCTACLIGLFQTHTIVFMQTAYICIPAFVIVRTLSPRPPAVYWKAVAAICLLFFALQLPYIINIDLSGIDSQVTSWIENWVRNTSHAWRGNLGNSFWSIPVYLYHRLNLDNMFLPLLLLTGLIGGISLWNKQREACLTYTLFFPFVFLLVLNCQYWVLPASYLIYPERTAAMLAIPIAVLAAAGLDLLLSKSRKDAANYIRLSILLVALGIGNFYSQQYYVNGIRGESTVTQSDMTALKWMASNIPHEALIANNYGDAGIWIPAMTGHSVVGPHVNIAVQFQAKKRTHPDYVFIGAKQVYGKPSFTAEKLLKQKGYTLLFRNGNTFIFKKIK